MKASATRISSGVSSLGTQIGQNLGLGLGIAAIAAGKMAVDFEAAFTRIGALSNASAADIERWKGEVLDLAGETAVAPQELADALFFLSSAGLKAGQVMATLGVSAKASAVGLGSTVEVANITASALNAYAGSALTAAQVTDTLVAAVREGRAEPDAFADALGRILPIAAQAGVSFQDVTASLAGLSNIGLEVDEAVTAMRGALQAIAAPGTQAANALDELGLSAQDLLDAISDRGLFGAFQLLDNAARRNTDTQAEYIGVLRKVIPNVRALTGVLGLTGQEAAKMRAIFEGVSHSTGSLNEAFAETAKGPAFTFQQLLADLQVAAIEVGEALIPLGKIIADVLGPVLRGVGANVGLVLGAFLGFKALSFLPSLLFEIGLGLEAIGAANAANALANTAGSLEAMGASLPVMLALADAIGAVYLAVKVLSGADPTFVPQLASFIEENTAKMPGFTLEMQRLARESDLTRIAAEELAGSLGNVAGSLLKGPEAFEETAKGASHFRSALAGASPLIEEMGTTVSEFTRTSVRDWRNAEDAEAQWAKTTADAMSSARDAIANWRTEAADNLSFVEEALSDFASNQDASVASLSRGFGSAIRDTRDFGRDIQRILRVGGKGAAEFADQLISMGAEGADAADRIAGANKDMIRSLVSDFNTGKAEAATLANQLSGEILGTLGDIRTLLKEIAKSWGINVDLHDNASGPIARIKAALLSIPRSITIAINTVSSPFNPPVQGPPSAPQQGPPSQPPPGHHPPDSRPTNTSPSSRSKVSGTLVMTDWHRGIAQMQAELDHSDRFWN